MVDFSMEDDPLDSQESNAIWQNLESGAAEQVQETAESVIPPLEPIVPSSSSASTLVVDGQQHFEDSTATSEIHNAGTRPGKHSTSVSDHAATTGDAESNLELLRPEKTHVNVDEKSTHFLSSKTTDWAGAVSPPNHLPITAEPSGVQGSELVRQGHPSAHGLVEWIPREGRHNLPAAACPLPVVRPPQQYFPPNSLHPLSPVQLGHYPLSAVHGALPPRVHPFNGQHVSYPSAFLGPTGMTHGAQGSDYSVFCPPGYGQPLLSPPGPALVNNTVRAPDGGGGFKIFHPGENHPKLLHAQQYHSQHQLHHPQRSQLEGMPASNDNARPFGNTTPNRTTSRGTPVPAMPPQHFHGHVHGIPPRASSREGHVAAPAPSGKIEDTQSSVSPAEDGGASSSSADAEADTAADAVSGDRVGGTTGVDVRGGEGQMECEERERQNSAYKDIGLVVARTKTLEMLLKDLFGASGNGLNDLLSSLKEDSRIDRRTQQKIRSIAAMRNKLVHSVDANKLSVSNTFGDDARRAFKKLVDDLETTLQEAAKKEREEPFQQGVRPTDAYKLGNHPAFRRIAGADEGEYDETAAMKEAAISKRAVVTKNKTRFPHNIVTESDMQMTRALSCSDAPDVADLREFPGITHSVAGRQPRSSKAGEAEMDSDGGGGSADGTTGGGGVAVGVGNGGWDGRVRIEETQVVSGRGVCRKLGQGGEGHVATTHTMSGVYRKWDLKPRNPMPSPAWNTAPKDTVLANTSRVIPGAGGDATGKVAFSARGLDLNKKASIPRGQGSIIRARSEGSNARDASWRSSRNVWEEAWNTRRKRGQKEDNRPPIHFAKKSSPAHFWLVPGMSLKYRGWFPTQQGWYARGRPSVYGPLEPSTEDRIETRRNGHGLPIELKLEGDEERQVWIAIRESAAEYEQAYQMKYGRQAEREARREAQARARAKAIAEQESLNREEREQLEKGIKASLQEVVRPGEEDDRDVIATIEASKQESSRDEDDDPETLLAIEESRRQHETRQEMLQVQLSYELDTSSPRDEGILFPQADSSLEERRFNRAKEQILLFSPSSSSSSSSSVFSIEGTDPYRNTGLFSGSGRHGPEAEAAGGAPLTGTHPTHSQPLWPPVDSLEGVKYSQEIEASIATTRDSARDRVSPRYPLGQDDGVPGVSWPKDAIRRVRPDDQLLQALQFTQSLTENCGEMPSSTGSVGVTDGQHREDALLDRQPTAPKDPPPIWQSFSVPELPAWASPAPQPLGVRAPPVGDSITVAENTCNNGGGGAGGSTLEYQELHELEASKGSSMVGLSGTVAAEDRELEAALEASRQAEAIREQEERDAKAAIDMAMELSVKEATAPPGLGASEPYLSSNGPPPFYTQPVYPGETVPSIDSAPFRTEGDDVIGSSALGETLEMVPAHPEDPSARESVAVVPGLTVIQQDDVPRETGPAVGCSDGANVLRLNPTIRSHETDKWEIGEEDGVARELRVALEEEEKFYESGNKGAGKGNGEALTVDPKAEGEEEDKLASMFKQSGLNVEQTTSMWVSEEEDVIASVLEESRREKQEEVAVEHRELEMALLASRSIR